MTAFMVTNSSVRRGWIAVLFILVSLFIATRRAAHASPGHSSRPPYWTGMTYINYNALWESSFSEKKRPDVARSTQGRSIHVYVDEGSVALDTPATLLARRTTQNIDNWAGNRDSFSSWPTITLFTAAAPGVIEPVIATDSNSTWIVAFSTITAAGDRDIYVTRNLLSGSNEGSSWSSPVLVSSLSGDAEDGKDDVDPHIIYEPISNTWIIAWESYQTRNGSGADSDVMFIISTNRGVTWSTPAFLNPGFASDNRLETEIKLFIPSPGLVQAAYRGYDVVGNIYHVYSVERNFSALGSSWSSETAFGPQVVSEEVKQFNIAVDMVNNVVVFFYTTFDGKIRWSVSTDGANTFNTPTTLHDGGDDPLDPVIDTDTRGVFVAVWSSTQTSFYGAQDRKWFNVSSSRDLFYSISTGQNNTGIGNGWSAPRALDHRNIAMSGSSSRPRIIVDISNRRWAVLFESDKSQYLLNTNTGTGYTWENSDTDVFFVWWNNIQRELCWERSSSIAAYCMEALQEKVNAAPKNASSWTTIPVARAYNPFITGLLSVVITDGRWISIQAEIPGLDTMQMSSSCNQNPFFIIEDSLSRFRFNKIGLRVISSPFLVDNRGGTAASNLIVQYDNSTSTSTFSYGQCAPYYLDLRCPLGFRPPDATLNETSCMPCPVEKNCVVFTDGSYRAYLAGNATYELPCPVGTVCPAGGMPTKCQSMKYYSPLDPPMTRQSHCNTTGIPCLPGYRCPAGAHVDNHTQVMTIDNYNFAETLVFPGDRTVQFTLRNIGTNPSRFVRYATPSPIPPWLGVWQDAGHWNPYPGQFTRFSAVLRSNVAGVSVSDLLESTYVINMHDPGESVVGDQMIAPFVVSFSRQVTSVIFSPETGIQKRVGLGDTGFNESIFIFNIGCTESVTYEATAWDCGHPEAPPITNAQGNETTFPQDWITIYPEFRNGSIRTSSADPAEVRIFLDPSKSVLQGGVLSTRLPASSNEVSKFGTAGVYIAKVCVRVRFVMQTQGIPLIKNVPIELSMYENCPVGYFSASGTSELGTCSPCQMGTFTDTTGTRACMACPESRPRSLPGARSLDECLTAPGTVRDADGSTVDCLSLGDGVACNTEGIPIERLPLRAGYWRSDNRSKRVMKCVHPAFCIGGDGIKRRSSPNQRRFLQLGNDTFSPTTSSPTASPTIEVVDTSTVDYCLEYHIGALCEGCEAGYVRRGANPCSICDAEALAADQVRLSWTIIAAIILLILAFVVVQRKQIFAFLFKAKQTANEFRRGSIHAFTSRTSNLGQGRHPAGGRRSNPGAVANDSTQQPVMSKDGSPDLNTVETSDNYNNREAMMDDRLSTRATSVDIGKRSKASTIGFLDDPELGGSGRRREPSSYGPRDRSWTKSRMLNASMRMSQRFQVKERASYLYRLFTSLESSVTLRILLSLFQVCSGISTTFLELFPPLFHQVVAILNVVSASIFYNIDFACVIRSNHYFSLVLSMLVPFLAVLLIVTGHIVMERRLRKQRKLAEITELRNGSYSLFLVLLFLVYPNVSNTILSTFACKKFDDGTSYLRKDLTIDCNAEGRDAFVGLAVFGTIIYVIGVPLVYFLSLLRVRKHILDESREDYQSVMFLVEPYRKECWWYEVFESARKLIQTSLLVFFLDGSVMQTMAMIAVSAVVIIIIYELKPYKMDQANRLASVAQWCILLIAFLGMLYKVDLVKLDSNFQYDKRSFLDVLVVMTLFVTPLLAIYQKRKFLSGLAYYQYKNLKSFTERWTIRIQRCWRSTTEAFAPCCRHCSSSESCCWCCPNAIRRNGVREAEIIESGELLAGGSSENGGAPQAEEDLKRVASSIMEIPLDNNQTSSNQDERR